LKKKKVEIAPNVTDADPELIQAKLKKMYALREQLLDRGGGLSQKEIDIRAECEESLSAFVKHAWKYIDPAPYSHNWHIEAIAEHLEAVVHGDLRHLLVNVPPRSGKSSILSAALVPWIWAQKEIGPISGPQVTALYASYAQTLSLRDSLKSRRLIESPFYQRLWGDRFKMTGDQNTKTRFENNKGGYRLATSVGGALTGEGGQLIVCDDPHNSIEAESELIRKGVIDWWDGALSTRHNHPQTGVYVVVMQRLHEDDLSGHIISKNSDDWCHLMIPMRFEEGRKCYTSIGFEDPRTEEGELLWPDRFGEKEVNNLERVLGPYSASGQLQQSPTPKGGGIIQEEWWQVYESKEWPPCNYIIASLDTAYTEKQENDYSAMTIWAIFTKILCLNAWQDRLELNKLVVKVQQKCATFKVDRLLIEDKAAGHSVAQELRRLFGGAQYAIQLVNPKNQDKVARMYSIQHLFSDKMVYVPIKDWADNLLIPQVSQFPKGKHDDLADTVSQALRYLRNTGWALRKEENDAIEAEEFAPKQTKEALYDV